MKTNPFHRFISFDISPLSKRTFGEIAASFSTTKTHERTADNVDFNEVDTIMTLCSLAFDKHLDGQEADVNAGLLHDVLRLWQAKDPSAGQYSSYGFTAPDPGVLDTVTEEPALCVAIQGRWQVVFNVQHRERILPAKIVSEKLADRVAEFEKREGRPANKKDWAILKDEVRASMLQTALVRRTDVPVILGEGYCHVFTSSAKRAEDICCYLRTIFGTWPVIRVFAPADIVSGWMKRVTEAQNVYYGGDQPGDFIPGHYAKMEDPRDDSVITVKNELARNSTGYTVGELSERGYLPTEMDMTFCPRGVTLNEDDELVPEEGYGVILRVTNKGVIKKFSFGDVSEETIEQRFGYHDDTPFSTKAWLVATEIAALFARLKPEGVLLDEDSRAKEEPSDAGVVDIELVQGGVVFRNGDSTVTITHLPEGLDGVPADDLDSDDITEALADEEDDEL